MKRTILSALVLLFFSSAFAQKASELRYVDAKELMLINQGFDNTELYYSRLPEDMKLTTRKAVWDLGLNSAGLALRFSSDSKCIGARWTLLNNFNMSHMAGTGIRGIDLYYLDAKGVWRFIGTAQPNGKESQNVFVRNMDGSMKEFMAYLPLYDGVTKVEIGVDSTSFIGGPKRSELTKGARKPIVIYGTSIAQGGCASRPGVVYSSIVSRARNQECVNLGFSGNARMDKSMAEIVSRIDADQFIIDCLPNCTAQMLRDSADYFMHYLLERHSDVPVFMVENTNYSYQLVDTKTAADFKEKNDVWKELYNKLRKEGYRKLYYIPAKGLNGPDFEGAVDGTHQTDLGFLRMSEVFLKYLKK